jgi:hypothetical protein
MPGINVGTIVRCVHAGAAIVVLLVCAAGAVRADDVAIFVTSPGQPLNVGADSYAGFARECRTGSPAKPPFVRTAPGGLGGAR